MTSDSAPTIGTSGAVVETATTCPPLIGVKSPPSSTFPAIVPVVPVSVALG